MLAAQSGGSIRIENETIRAVVSSSKGSLTISDPRTGKRVATHNARPIPPIWPTEYDKKDFTLRLNREDDMVVAIASVKSDKHPGFVFRKIVRMNAGPIITIDHEFENTGPDAFTFRLSGNVDNDNMTHATLTLPLLNGPVQGPCQDFPGLDISNRDAVYAEQWAAYEHPQTTIGVFWPEDVEEYHWNWQFGMATRSYDCPPRSLIRTGRLYLYVGDGDWRTVQRTWQRMQGQTIRIRETLPEASGTLSASFDPPVTVAENDQAQVDLRVTHSVFRKCSGRAGIQLPEGWEMGEEDRTIPFADLNWEKPFDHALALTTTAAPGASMGRIEVRSSDYNADFEAPFIRLGDGQVVSVKNQETDGHRVWTIANGRVEVDVTPSFAGTVSAIRENGVNHLVSAFPEEDVFSWLHPWHGGIMTMIHVPGVRYPGIAASETFEASEVDQADGFGITWRGVRQRSALAHEEAQGLVLEIDTLTVGGSPVIKHVFRLVNETTSLRQIEAGWIAFLQPDGDMSNTMLHVADYQRNRSPRTPSIDGQHWAAAQNPDTGRAIALVSPTRSVAIDDWGTHGGHLKQRIQHTIMPQDRVEVTGYFAIAQDMDEVQGYAALRHVV